MKRTILMLTLIALLGLIATAAFAQPAGRGQGQGQGRAWMANLTVEQRTQLQAKIKELREANAKPEEIKAAVTELCKGWGLEPPQHGMGPGNANAVGAALTEEQWTQLEAKIKELRAANAKSGEIRTALAELYKGWGIERPQRGEGAGNGNRFGANLTEEQSTQLQAKIKELRAANAKPEEIKAAIAELYKGWGIEMPQRGEGGQGNGNGLGANLTEEQRTQLQAKIKELRAADAKPEDIRAAVAELYKAWGIEMPKHGERGQGQGNRFGANLTEEQRAQLQAKIKELRAADTKPEEMKAAIAEMYKGWGLEAPQGGKGGEGRGALTGPLQDLTDEQRQQVLTKVDEMQKAGSPPEEIRRTIREMIQGFGDKA